MPLGLGPGPEVSTPTDHHRPGGVSASGGHGYALRFVLSLPLPKEIVLGSTSQNLAPRLQYNKHRLPFALPPSAKHPLVTLKSYLCGLGTSVKTQTDALACSSHSEREAANTAMLLFLSALQLVSRLAYHPDQLFLAHIRDIGRRLRSGRLCWLLFGCLILRCFGRFPGCSRRSISLDLYRPTGILALNERHHVLVGFENRYLSLFGTVDHNGFVNPCCIGVGDGGHPVEGLVFNYRPGFEQNRIPTPLIVR